MSKGDGTRSGLLWEVERLLNECKELPQILLMENVPQVHGKKNMSDFQQWIDFLDSKGYTSKWCDLNSKDFGIPQNRNRCFMVSWLGNYTYEFPKPFPLTKTMQDFLEDEVDEKYYVNSERADKLIEKLILEGTLDSENGNSKVMIDSDGNKIKSSAMSSEEEIPDGIRKSWNFDTYKGD